MKPKPKDKETKQTEDKSRNMMPEATQNTHDN
jgi:hypothetical protein